MSEPYFLTLAEIVEIHSDQIKRYGGESFYRDLYEMASGHMKKPQFADILRQLST